MPTARTSLQKKLTLAILTTGIAISLLLLGLFFLAEVSSFRHHLQRQTTTLARIIGNTTSDPLQLIDQKKTRAILAALNQAEPIRFAYIFDQNKTPLAQYIAVDQPRDYLDKDHLERILDSGVAYRNYSLSALTVVLPIYDARGQGPPVATLYLQAGFDALSQRLRWLIVGLFVCLLAAITAAFFLSVQFRDALIGPTLRLVQSMNGVSFHGAQTPRVKKESEDEVGQLAEAFNMMLDHVAQRNSQLEQHRNELEKTIKQRTMDLHQANKALAEQVQKLDQSRLSAEKANTAKSTFLANISHEIRTPMIGILSAAELLEQSELAPQQKQMAALLSRSGKAMMHLLNDVLDFSKIEAGKLELDPQINHLGEIIEESTCLMAPKAFAKHLELVCQIDPRINRPVHLDGGRLRQVLLNLVGNAIKFTPEGQVVVKAEVADKCEQDIAVRFSIVDTGVGIAKGSQNDIFGLFTQEDSSTARTYGGTGLGLSIVKQLVDLMGGQVELQSERGAGSTFSFTLTLPYAADAVEPLPCFENLRIAIVEDNEACANALQQMLRARGAKVDSFLPEAQQTLSARLEAHLHVTDIDLVLIDADLNRQQDEVITKTIQQQTSSPVCLLLAPNDVKGSRSGDDICGQHLIKPLRQKDVFEVIQRALNVGSPPLHPNSDRATHAETKEDAHPLRGSRSEGSRRVLVVEDNGETQRIVEQILHDHGCEVTLADRGQTALQHCEQKSFDLILMDGHMPEMDGYQTTKALRTIGLECPIIGLTADPFVDRMDGQNAGMNDCLKKPFTIEEIRTMVDKWLRKGSDAR